MARAHAKAWPERRRNCTQKIAAAGAASFDADRGGGVRAKPVTTRFALWIDALDGEAGQILHSSSPAACVFEFVKREPRLWPESPTNRRIMRRILPLDALGVKGKTPPYIGVAVQN